MKHILISISLLFYAAFSLNAQNQDLFFSLVQGEKFYYTCYDDSGEVEAYYSLLNKSITGDLSDGKVCYEYLFLDEKREPLFSTDKGHMDMDITLNSDGVLSRMYDLGKSMTIQEIVTLGDVTSLPKVMTVGQKIPTGVIKLKIKSIGASFNIYDREVLAIESITTPAGTFPESYKIKERQVTKIPLKSTEYFYTSWYVRNIGVVKQVIVDKKGKTVRSIELSKIEN